MPTPAPKVATADSGFQAILDQAATAADQLGAAASQIIFGPWKAYAVSVGQSGPANVNRARRAIRAIPGAGR